MPATNRNGEVVRKEKPQFVCPFKVRAINPCLKPGELRMITRVTDQVKVNSETLQALPISERYDVDKEIQTYKDQCGLELFKQMLATGRAKPSDSHDDGKHGLDTTVIPETIHEAKAAADANAAAIATIAQALGIKDGKGVSSEDLIEMLSAKVQANIDAAKNPVPSAPDTAKESK